MDIKSIIRKKRDSNELTKEEIKYFVGKLTKGEITDAQAGAVLSYICTNGLTEDEILNFSVSMAESGDMVDFSDITKNIVDKHATGGVGDKATILLMPILASLGMPVAKVSSRGYGISGGTIDKLESIPGFTTDLTIEEFKENVRRIDVSIMNQGLNLAPAESKIYRLRNETACENSVPIIAASLMSLKIATGSKKIVFDISFGKGTYISNKNEAKRLAKLLVRLGKSLQKEVACVITNMNQPIGYSIGHNLEIKETIMALKGVMAEDLEEVVETLGSVMISLASDKKDLNENAKLIKEAIKSGKAYEKFKEMVRTQHGDVKYIEKPELFKEAKYCMPVLSTEDGVVESIDADMVGSIAVYLGAGRMKDEKKVNKTAGITISKKVGDNVKVGETLAYVYTDDKEKVSGTTQNLIDAFKFTTKKVSEKSKIIEIIK